MVCTQDIEHSNNTALQVTRMGWCPRTVVRAAVITFRFTGSYCLNDKPAWPNLDTLKLIKLKLDHLLNFKINKAILKIQKVSDHI